jgi:hypothetical protein
MVIELLDSNVKMLSLSNYITYVVVADTVARRIACASITITSIVVFMNKQILETTI